MEDIDRAMMIVHRLHSEFVDESAWRSILFHLGDKGAIPDFNVKLVPCGEFLPFIEEKIRQRFPDPVPLRNELALRSKTYPWIYKYDPGLIVDQKDKDGDIGEEVKEEELIVEKDDIEEEKLIVEKSNFPRDMSIYQRPTPKDHWRLGENVEQGTILYVRVIENGSKLAESNFTYMELIITNEAAALLANESPEKDDMIREWITNDDPCIIKYYGVDEMRYEKVAIARALARNWLRGSICACGNHFEKGCSWPIAPGIFERSYGFYSHYDYTIICFLRPDGEDMQELCDYCIDRDIGLGRAYFAGSY